MCGVRGSTAMCKAMCYIMCCDLGLMIDRRVHLWLTFPMSMGSLLNLNSYTFHKRDSSAQAWWTQLPPSPMFSKTRDLEIQLGTRGHCRNLGGGVHNFLILLCMFFSECRHSPRYQLFHHHLQTELSPWFHFQQCSGVDKPPHMYYHIHHLLLLLNAGPPQFSLWLSKGAWGKDGTRKVWNGVTSRQGCSLNMSLVIDPQGQNKKTRVLSASYEE